MNPVSVKQNSQFTEKQRQLFSCAFPWYCLHSSLFFFFFVKLKVCVICQTYKVGSTPTPKYSIPWYRVFFNRNRYLWTVSVVSKSFNTSHVTTSHAHSFPISSTKRSKLFELNSRTLLFLWGKISLRQSALIYAGIYPMFRSICGCLVITTVAKRDPEHWRKFSNHKLVSRTCSLHLQCSEPCVFVSSGQNWRQK